MRLSTFCGLHRDTEQYMFTLTWDFGSAQRSGTGQAKPSEQPGKTVMASIFNIICGGNV